MSDQSLVQTFIDMQRRSPGCWDGRFVNFQGEHYSEAKHGLNPMEQGFCIYAPVPKERAVRGLAELRQCRAGPT
jgi:hypothetical protein